VVEGRGRGGVTVAEGLGASDIARVDDGGQSARARPRDGGQSVTEFAYETRLFATEGVVLVQRERTKAAAPGCHLTAQGGDSPEH
jgi:hypothetical protein